MTEGRSDKILNMMNSVRIILLLLLLYACHQSGNSHTEHITAQNNANPCLNSDSLLVRYSEDFQASHVDLGKSLSDSFSTFFTKMDIVCLRSQKSYRYSILLVLSKLALHHLKCCNQGYDLLQMNGIAAEKIVNEFLSISGISRHNTEMISSGYVLDFVAADSVAQVNPLLREILIEFRNEQKRIETEIN